jgi:hypothetical protein
MTLPRVSAPVVALGQILDRADTPDELESLWLMNDGDGFRGKDRTYLLGIYRGVIARCQRNAAALDLARAS